MLVRLVALLAVVAGALASAPAMAQKGTEFPLLTIQDPGRPFTPIQGGCFFQMNSNLFNVDFSGKIPPTAVMLDNAVKLAGENIEAIAKKVNADALLGMTVSPLMVNDPVSGKPSLMLSGIWLCGTFVRYNPPTKVSAAN